MTPAVNAVAFIIVATTILVAIIYEVRRHNRAKQAAEAARRAQAADVAMAAGIAQTQPQGA
jgi:flagellar biosynthesis/type III secretory pathway M-ring protein FliF/YscJ